MRLVIGAATPIAIAIVSLVCCSPPDLSVRPLNAPIAAPMPELPDAGPGEAVTLPRSAPALEPVTCRWDADTFESDKPLSLSATWDTHQPFATLTRATKLDVVFSETNVDVLGFAFVDVGGHFSMQAIIPTAQLSFYPKKARVIDGYLVPSPSVAFAKPRLEPAVKLAVVDLACPGVDPAGGLVTEWPCEEIGVLPDRYEADAMLPRERVREAALARGKAIALATTPKGTTVATLKLERGLPANVVVTETSRDQSRIVWRSSRCSVFGWVATKDLGAPARPPKTKAKPTPVPPTVAAKTEPPVDTRTCKGAVPFVVAGTLIGQLLPDHPIDIAEHQQDGWSRLVLPSAGPMDETHFLARTSDLELCTKKADPP